jgi:hypothetical protein
MQSARARARVCVCVGRGRGLVEGSSAYESHSGSELHVNSEGLRDCVQPGGRGTSC